MNVTKMREVHVHVHVRVLYIHPMHMYMYIHTCTCLYNDVHVHMVTHDRCICTLYTVQFMMTEVEWWSPDVFKLDEISAGNSLVCVAYNIFKTRGLSCHFKVCPRTFINFMQAIQVCACTFIHCVHVHVYVCIHQNMCM